MEKCILCNNEINFKFEPKLNDDGNFYPFEEVKVVNWNIENHISKIVVVFIHRGYIDNDIWYKILPKKIINDIPSEGYFCNKCFSYKECLFDDCQGENKEREIGMTFASMAKINYFSLEYTKQFIQKKEYDNDEDIDNKYDINFTNDWINIVKEVSDNGQKMTVELIKHLNNELKSGVYNIKQKEEIKKIKEKYGIIYDDKN